MFYWQVDPIIVYHIYMMPYLFIGFLYPKFEVQLGPPTSGGHSAHWQLPSATPALISLLLSHAHLQCQWSSYSQSKTYRTYLQHNLSQPPFTYFLDSISLTSLFFRLLQFSTPTSTQLTPLSWSRCDGLRGLGPLVSFTRSLHPSAFCCRDPPVCDTVVLLPLLCFYDHISVTVTKAISWHLCLVCSAYSQHWNHICY